MHSPSTAILYLREPAGSALMSIAASLRSAIRGVEEVQDFANEGVLAVSFDSALGTLADIVRVVESCGSSVTGVAQRSQNRPAKLRRAI